LHSLKLKNYDANYRATKTQLLSNAAVPQKRGICKQKGGLEIFG